MTNFRCGSFTRIKDLSDKRRLPRLGKIRLGVKATTSQGKEYPREVSHFVVPPEVEAVYGEKPTQLDVMFPINDIETVFPQAYKFYGSGRGLKCVGNGECALRLDEKTQVMQERPCPCELLEKGACQRRAHLLVMLPQVSVGGIYQIDMGSYHSIVDLNSGLDYVQALVGRFAMVPLILKRVPRETHEGGKKAVHYPLQILLAQADMKTVEALRDDNRRVLTAAARLAIAPPKDGNPAVNGEAVDEVFDVGPEGTGGEEGDTSPDSSVVSEGATPLTESTPPATPAEEPSPASADATGAAPPPIPPSSPAPPPPPPPKKGNGGNDNDACPAASAAQQAAILKLAMKAGIEEGVVLEKIRGVTQAAAAQMIVSLQRGNLTGFRQAA